MLKKYPLLLLLLLPLCSIAQKQPYKVIAYYTGHADSLKQYPLDKLTHIIYSFLHLHGDSLAFDSEQQQQNVQQIVALKKQYPHLKIMISLGGWGGCETCSAVFETEAQRQTFANTTAALLQQNNIDGIDLDWEYPAIEGYPGHRYSPTDKQNFTALVKALRNAMAPGMLLTFAAGGFEDYLHQSIEWDNVIPYIDFVNLMTYDLVSGFSKVTGHHTPLKDYRSGQQSTQKCVDILIKKGVPKEKLIIGAAFYARVWEQVAPANNGLYNDGNFKQGVSYKKFPQYFSDTSGFVYYWDKKAHAPYRYNATEQLFATFDDERSVKAKTKYVRKKKLGGIMFWELVDDAYTGGLVDAIQEALQ
jgi:chitinase